ncbi:unknown [Prevotella sp. CAG:592]|nr:unknown [Prevotella sp. CAG:592]
MNSGNVSFLIYNKDVQALNDYYDMANDTYFSG